MASKNSKLTPSTGNKAFDIILISILVISILGIVAFGYSGIIKLVYGSLFASIPNIMYVMTFISIAMYTRNYFIRRKKATISFMLQNYCLLILMTTFTLPGIENHNLMIILVIATTVIIPFMQKDLFAIKRCIVILFVVFALVLAITILKIANGMYAFTGDNPVLLFCSYFGSIFPLFVWVVFMVLYGIRAKLS